MRESSTIYESEFVADLFNRMSDSYDRMNYITSFGFSVYWRKRFISQLDIESEARIADLMTGMGECWRPIRKKLGSKGQIIALDFSEGMLKHARRRRVKMKDDRITILKEDIFANTISSSSLDHVVSGFGIKTFSSDQLKDLADQFYRVLKSGGSFSVIDISIPPNPILRKFYLFYLKRIIPVLGALFLGNPDTYRMLGIYTEQFRNSRQCEQIFKKRGFKIEYKSYFFGCATGLVGYKD